MQSQDFTYITNDGAITITAYTGSSGQMTVPSEINGMPVTSIADAAFRFSGISLARVPETVTNIGFQAFAYCGNLTSIDVGALNTAYSSGDGVLFDKQQSTLIQCPSGKTGVYAIPSTVTTILEWAFAGCDNLKSVTIPNGVSGIPPHGLYMCHGLTNVSIPNTVFSIGDQSFASCSSLTSLRLPNGLASIGFDAFNHSGLINITIPDSVRDIQPMAFAYCGNLTRIILPNHLTGIADQVFMGCTSLNTITIPPSVTSIGNAVFFGCTNLAAVFFEGNAPSVGGDVFRYFGSGAFPPLLWDPTTVYYLPGTLDWDVTFGGVPTAVWWLPHVDTSPATFGVQSNLFGFTIQWPFGLTVIVEACTNLSGGNWSPVSTNRVINGSGYFIDPQSKNYPRRFYRILTP